MATKEKAMQYAQDAANRSGKVYAIQRCNNGQWLYASKQYYDMANLSDAERETITTVTPSPQIQRNQK